MGGIGGMRYIPHKERSINERRIINPASRSRGRYQQQSVRDLRGVRKLGEKFRRMHGSKRRQPFSVCYRKRQHILKCPIDMQIPTGQKHSRSRTTHNYIISRLPAERKEKIMELLKKVGFEKFINRVYGSLRGYYADGDAEESGQEWTEEGFNKAEIIRMLEHVHDEKFLNQIRALLKLQIEKKGDAA